MIFTINNTSKIILAKYYQNIIWLTILILLTILFRSWLELVQSDYTFYKFIRSYVMIFTINNTSKIILAKYYQNIIWLTILILLTILLTI